MRTAGSARWAEDYERGRPGYPAGVVEVSQVPASATVLDLGAGTGKLTRVLVDRFARVIAVEPAQDMRRVLTMLCPGAQVLGGRAEQIPLANGSVDAVFAAESFHWFDNERALVEIARVLRPRGTLVLMWNLPAGATVPSIAAVEKHLDERRANQGELGYDPLDLNPSRYASGQWRLGFAHSAFEELHEVRLLHEQAVDSEELLAFFASMGWIGDLPVTIGHAYSTG